MSPEEDVIALIVKRHYLTTLDFRLRREQSSKEMSSKQTQWGSEIIKDKLWGVISGVAVTGQLLPFNPVADGEMEGRAMRQMYKGQASRFLLVFFQYHHGGVVPIRCKRGYLAYGEFVAVSMG